MLRLLLVLLLLVNLGLAAWNLGWLGTPAAADREPQRLAQQVNPQAVTLLAPQAASQALAQAAAAQRAATAAAGPASGPGATATAPDAPVCYEAGPLAVTEVAAAEKALREVTPPLPRWSTVRHESGGSYLVYMGRYADAAALAKKREELKRLNVDAEEVTGPPQWQPGLSLGRFDDRAAADAALTRTAQRGVKTARVLVLAPPVVVTQLRFEAVTDEALRQRLLQVQLPPGGLGFKPCVKP